MRRGRSLPGLQEQQTPQTPPHRKVMTPKYDEAILFRTFLTPVVFFSSTAILTATINVRLMSIVARLRHYIHAKRDAAQNSLHTEVEAYADQIGLIEKRAELIR
jgi:hypothetical protein